MSDTTYSLILDGTVKAEADHAEAVAQLAKRLRLSTEHANKYLAGTANVIKSGLSQTQARLYEKVLQTSGIVCEIMAENDPDAIIQRLTPTSYQVILAGTISDTTDYDTALKQLCQQLYLSPEQGSQLLSGISSIAKSGLTEQQAQTLSENLNQQGINSSFKIDDGESLALPQRYQIMITGEFKSGTDQQQAKQQLAQHLRLSDDHIDKILASPNFVIKSGLSEQQANAHAQVIQSYGIHCNIQTQAELSDETENSQEQGYRLILTGELELGTDKVEAQNKLAEIFCLSPSHAEKLLSGMVSTLKSGLPQNQADHYQQRLATVGIKSIVQDAANPDANPIPKPDNKKFTLDFDPEQLSLEATEEEAEHIVPQGKANFLSDADNEEPDQEIQAAPPPAEPQGKANFLSDADNKEPKDNKQEETTAQQETAKSKANFITDNDYDDKEQNAITSEADSANTDNDLEREIMQQLQQAEMQDSQDKLSNADTKKDNTQKLFIIGIATALVLTLAVVLWAVLNKSDSDTPTQTSENKASQAQTEQQQRLQQRQAIKKSLIANLAKMQALHYKKHQQYADTGIALIDSYWKQFYTLEEVKIARQLTSLYVDVQLTRTGFVIGYAINDQRWHIYTEKGDLGERECDALAYELVKCIQ